MKHLKIVFCNRKLNICFLKKFALLVVLDESLLKVNQVFQIKKFKTDSVLIRVQMMLKFLILFLILTLFGDYISVNAYKDNEYQRCNLEIMSDGPKKDAVTMAIDEIKKDAIKRGEFKGNKII